MLSPKNRPNREWRDDDTPQFQEFWRSGKKNQPYSARQSISLRQRPSGKSRQSSIAQARLREITRLFPRAQVLKSRRLLAVPPAPSIWVVTVPVMIWSGKAGPPDNICARLRQNLARGQAFRIEKQVETGIGAAACPPDLPLVARANRGPGRVGLNPTLGMQAVSENRILGGEGGFG